MWKLGILAIIIVYSILALSLAASILITRIIKGNSVYLKLSEKLITYLFLLFGIIYLLPDILIAMIFFTNPVLSYIMAIIKGLSLFPVAKFIIVPLSLKNHLKNVENAFGKDHEYAKYLREKQKNIREVDFSTEVWKEDIKSKSGICYRLEFDEKKHSCKVTCLSATGACSFLKREIHYAMDPLNLKVLNVGFEDITYKCPSCKKLEVIQRIKEC